MFEYIPEPPSDNLAFEEQLIADANDTLELHNDLHQIFMDCTKIFKTVGQDESDENGRLGQ
ncbi:MAG: hypothetical protein R6U96_08175 [Promethearchaeia archaeon]